MPEEYSVQRGRGIPRGGPRGGWDGVDRRRGGGRRWNDRRRRRPRFYFPYPPIFYGYPRYRCDYYDRYGRCCDRYGRCCDRYGRCYNQPYPRYFPMGNPEMDWEDGQMDGPMLMAGTDDDMYYED